MYNKFNFSDLKNSIGVIYIVRDPRQIVTSFAHNNNETIENSTKLLINDKTIAKEIDGIEVYLGSWLFNYNSWKIYQPTKRYFLLKYEDLFYDTKNSFIKILNFINSLGSAQLPIHEDKVLKLINTAQFPQTENQWKDELNFEMINKIENELKSEMIELGYL